MSKPFTLLPYGGRSPDIHPSVFIADGVRVIGDVIIGENSGVWFNSVIRGDVDSIVIGKMTNIQDGCVLHVSEGASLIIEDYVTAGHMVCLHGCTIRHHALIGIGATVLDKAIVEPYSMVAAGSVVTPGTSIPSGKLAAGVPAKIIRDLRKEEIEYFEQSATHYFEYAQNFYRLQTGIQNG